jgi:outer membrane protein insertion porin family
VPCLRACVLVLFLFETAAASEIESIEITGNRRIESDAIKVQLRSRRGAQLDPATLRDDVHALWKLGTFSDVQIAIEDTAAGRAAVTFVVTERPAIRKVLIAGNDGLGLDKLNEVLDLERDAVVDIAKIRRNRNKLAELYDQQGYYLATVEFELVPVNEGEVDVRYTVDERAKIRVRDVEFLGNAALSDDELRGVIATRRADSLSFMNDTGTYRRDAFERDLSLVTAHYWDRGYATVKVGAPQLRLSRDKKFMYVAVPVEEGPVFAFGSVDWKGDLIGSKAANLARTIARPGTRFSRTLVERDRRALETYYQDQGYAYANVAPRLRLEPAHRRVELVYEIARGKRVYIERIHIRGNSKTRDKVIRREMKVGEGELFSNSNLEVSKRRITALGYFEAVEISTQRGSSDEFIDVNVEVRERQTGTFQIGAGFSSAENFIAQAQVSYDNLFGRGQSFQFQAQISSVRRLFLLRLVDPYFLDTPWTFAFDLYNQSRGYGAYSRNATGGSLTWGYPLSYNARAFLTYKLEDVDITTGTGVIANFGARATPIETASTGNLLRGGWTSSVRASLVWDSRDNRLFPTAGWHATAFAEYAGRYTGSQNEYMRWGGFARYYKRLWGPFVLRLNGEVGVTTSLDRKGVPLTERYLLGGIYDIRGYGMRTLGPRFLTQSQADIGASLRDDLPLGGNLQVIGNAEIEFPLVKRIGLSGVVFFDVGNAFNLEDRYCAPRATSPVAATVDPCFRPGSLPTGLRKSVGVGVRWFSPIGPLRLEWGIPLDLVSGESSSGIDFTIGTSF